MGTFSKLAVLQSSTSLKEKPKLVPIRVRSTPFDGNPPVPLNKALRLILLTALAKMVTEKLITPAEEKEMLSNPEETAKLINLNTGEDQKLLMGPVWGLFQEIAACVYFFNHTWRCILCHEEKGTFLSPIAKNNAWRCPHCETNLIVQEGIMPDCLLDILSKSLMENKSQLIPLSVEKDNYRRIIGIPPFSIEIYSHLAPISPEASTQYCQNMGLSPKDITWTIDTTRQEVRKTDFIMSLGENGEVIINQFASTVQFDK
jgi:hypothetical protein